METWKILLKVVLFFGLLLIIIGIVVGFKNIEGFQSTPRWPSYRAGSYTDKSTGVKKSWNANTCLAPAPPGYTGSVGPTGTTCPTNNTATVGTTGLPCNIGTPDCPILFPGPPESQIEKAAYDNYEIYNLETPPPAVTTNLQMFNSSGSISGIDAGAPIPWDIDNKMLDPKAVLWGTIHPNTSQDIFKVAYMRMLFSSANNFEFNDSTQKFEYASAQFNGFVLHDQAWYPTLQYAEFLADYTTENVVETILDGIFQEKAVTRMNAISSYAKSMVNDPTMVPHPQVEAFMKKHGITKEQLANNMTISTNGKTNALTNTLSARDAKNLEKMMNSDNALTKEPGLFSKKLRAVRGYPEKTAALNARKAQLLKDLDEYKKVKSVENNAKSLEALEEIARIEKGLPETMSNIGRYQNAQKVRKQAILAAKTALKDKKITAQVAEAAIREAETAFKVATKEVSAFTKISGTVSKALRTLDYLLTPIRFIEEKIVGALAFVLVKAPLKITASVLKLIGLEAVVKFLQKSVQKLGQLMVVKISALIVGVNLFTGIPGLQWIPLVIDIFSLTLIAVIPAIFNAYIPSDAICPEGYPFNLETAVQESSSAGVVGWAILSSIPVIGDCLSVFAPYICSTNDLTASAVKIPYRPPTYYFDSTLSLFCDMDKAPMAPNHPAFNDKRRYYELANGYNILANTNNTVLPDNRPNGERVYAPIWVDFSHPDMLDKMADFYYTKSRQFAQTNYDGSATFEYISKFYGIIASSRYSCDVQCEITSVTYYPFTGIEQSRTIVPVPEGGNTTYHDRRFYFFVDKTLDGLKDGINYLSGLDRQKYAQGTSDQLDLLMIDNMNRYIISGCTNTDGTGTSAQEVTEEGGYAGDALISLGDNINKYYPPIILQLAPGGKRQTDLPKSTDCSFVKGKLSNISKRAALPQPLPPKKVDNSDGIFITKAVDSGVWGGDDTAVGNVFNRSTKIFKATGTMPSTQGTALDIISNMVTGALPLRLGLAGGLIATTYNALPVFPDGQSINAALTCLWNDLRNETGTYVLNGNIITSQPASSSSLNYPSGWIINRGPTIEYAPGYTPFIGNPKNAGMPTWNKCGNVNIVQQDCTSRFSVRRAIDAFNSVYGSNQRLKRIYDIQVRQKTDLNSSPMCVYTADIINLDNMGGEVGDTMMETFAINYEIQSGDDTCTYVPIGCNRSDPIGKSRYSPYESSNPDPYSNTFLRDSTLIPVYETIANIKTTKQIPRNLLVTPGDGKDYGPSLNAFAFLNGWSSTQVVRPTGATGAYNGNPCEYIKESMRQQFNDKHGVDTGSGYRVSIASSSDMVKSYTPDAEKFRKSVIGTPDSALIGQCIYVVNITQTFPPQQYLSGSTLTTIGGPTNTVLFGDVITMNIKTDPIINYNYLLASDDYDQLSSSLRANPNPNPAAFKLDTCTLGGNGVDPQGQYIGPSTGGTYDSCSDLQIQTRIRDQFNAYYGGGQVDNQPQITSIYNAYTPDASLLTGGAQCIFDCQITTNDGVNNTVDRRTITMQLVPTIRDPTKPNSTCLYDYSSDDYPKQMSYSKVPRGATWFDVPSEPPVQSEQFLRSGCTDAEAQRVSGYSYAHASDYKDCSGSYVIRNLINQFNTHFTDTKILSVTRASTPQTPGGNTVCDYEVQMLRTFGAKQDNVTEKETVRLYLNPSNNNKCDYDVDFSRTNSAPNTGISITTNSSIDVLGTPYTWSTKLIDWVKHGINNSLLNFQNIQPAAVVRSEALSAKVAVDNLYATVQSFKGVAGTKITCREPQILQKIINRWNYDSMPLYPDPSGQYGQFQTMVKEVRKAEPNSSQSGCVVELIEQNVTYEDYLDNYFNNPDAKGSQVYENPSIYLRQYNFELTLGSNGEFTVNPFTKGDIANRTMALQKGDTENGYLNSSNSNIPDSVLRMLNYSAGIKCDSPTVLAYVKKLYENTPVGRVPGAPSNNTISKWLKWFSPRPDVCEYQVNTKRYMLDRLWGNSGTWKMVDTTNTYITAYWKGYSVDFASNPSLCPTLYEFHEANYNLSVPDFSTGGVVIKAISKADQSVYTTPEGGTQLPYLVFQNPPNTNRVKSFTGNTVSGSGIDSVPSGITISPNVCSV
jgi:hypothetical protein